MIGLVGIGAALDEQADHRDILRLHREDQRGFAAAIGLNDGGLPVEQLLGAVGEVDQRRSEEHTSALQSIMRISYAVFCLKKKTHHHTDNYIILQYYYPH